MMNQNSEDWLPPGWTVKIKVRKSGKKDKYYFEPSSQMRFNSRAEVSRYLKTAAIYHPESEESRIVEQPVNNVEVKKAIAEELPPGWIREIRVTRIANRIRRDSFYIDPVTGNALRSIRDVHRYLTTGKVSRLAYKSRNQRNSELEFQNDDISVSALKSPAVSKKEMLTIGKARRQIVWSQNSSEPSEIINDEAFFQNSVGVRESMPLSEPTSGSGHDHGGIGTKLHNPTLAEAKDPEQSKEKNDFSEVVSTPVKSIPHKLAIENEPTKNEIKKRQRKSKDMNLPRRASKRLAGLEADPVLEVKAGRRARPLASEESDTQVSSSTKWASQCSENPDVKHETKSIIDRRKSTDTNPDSSRKEDSDVKQSPLLQLSVEDVKKVKSEDAYEDKADVKQGPLLKLPVEDLLTDPCIAFAVKTLTGGVFDASISSEALLVPNNIDRPSTVYAAPNEKRTVEPESKLAEKLPSPELPVDNVVKKLESTLELPVGEILADPCIEFAIKTLTGEIPLDNNLDIEDYFHQLGSSKAQGTSANVSKHVGSDHFYSNVLSQKQQPILALAASPSINFRSCGTGLLGQERNRNNEFQRR
ncbi:methyl-CpG-binding domain-containing protein 13 isoform X2 [Momordica charantia]|uniref:Methyl-CpG-binding domain-containing protein 13 isoform X2 n=1 Tax=Momordica charantia TaxID=3673 RepID=A0A6J1CGC7_MOMCH|nr:methyl-CpG-binding domain-containing protein 13 isoform X2 [Momordica charantia]